MARRKELTAEEMMDLDVKVMLKGAMHRFGGCAEFGRQWADLCAAETEGGMPTAVPDGIRMQGLRTLGALLGQHGDGGDSSNLIDDEALDARLAQLNANPPPDDTQEPFDDDDSE